MTRDDLRKKAAFVWDECVELYNQTQLKGDPTNVDVLTPTLSVIEKALLATAREAYEDAVQTVEAIGESEEASDEGYEWGIADAIRQRAKKLEEK